MGFIYTRFDENSWLCKTEMEFIYTRFDENSWLCKTEIGFIYTRFIDLWISFLLLAYFHINMYK